MVQEGALPDLVVEGVLEPGLGDEAGFGEVGHVDKVEDVGSDLVGQHGQDVSLHVAGQQQSVELIGVLCALFGCEDSSSLVDVVVMVVVWLWCLSLALRVRNHFLVNMAMSCSCSPMMSCGVHVAHFSSSVRTFSCRGKCV